jgi:methyl-accepting chemotaxis protein
MKVQCSQCRKSFRVAGIEKLDETRGSLKFKCPLCGHGESLVKKASESWSQYFEHSAAAPAVEAPPPTAPSPSVAHKPPKLARPEPPPPVEEAAVPEEPSPSETERKTGFLSGLTGKVVLLMLVVSLLPLGIYSIVINRSMVERIESDTDRVGQQITGGLTGQVNEWTDKNLRVLQAVSQTADITSMDAARQEPTLKSIAAAYPWKYLVFTTDARGRNIARSDGAPLTDYSDRQYFKDVVLTKKPFSWQTLVGRTTQKPALILAVPIIRDGQVVGSLCSAMHVEDISNNIVRWKAGKTGYAFLVDQTGKVVAHQVEEHVKSEKVLNAHPLIANFKKGQYGLQQFKEGGSDKVGFVRDTLWGWKVAIQQDDEEVFASLHEANMFALALLGITIALVLIVAVLAGRSIVRPIQVLTQAAERISTGDLEVQIEVKSKNEIGELAVAIGRMQDSIRFAIDRLRRYREKKGSHQTQESHGWQTGSTLPS